MMINAGYASSLPLPDQVDAKPDWPSHNAGLEPEFYRENSREFVIIRACGDSLSAASHPLDDALKERFADEYRAWKEDSAVIHRGTPLEELVAVNERMSHELKGLNIHTIEQLAQISDGNIHRLVNGRDLRNSALAWLKSKDAAALVAENAALLARIDALERGMKGLPKKPGVRTMPKEQRERIAEFQRQRWAGIKSRLGGAVASGLETPPAQEMAQPATAILPPAE